MISERDKKILEALIQFTDWLEKFGEISQDHQDFYASWIGRYSKKLYYKSALLGKVVVAPAVFCEAFLPFTRKLFHPPMRLPISDAHFAMGFAMMYKLLKKEAFLKKCKHFLDVLEKTRCVKFKNYCWGYPFDWQTKGGTIPQGTPLITTTPYGYEAFELAYDICPDEKWLKVMRSVADHALYDIDDKEIATDTNSCAYYPNAGYLVINASSYRAGLLCKAFKRFNSDEYLVAARKNVNFVIQSQNKDGSWPYAVDGTRNFIDHFHTCFVLKGLIKAEKIIDDKRITESIARGIDYYVNNLFDSDELPKPFSKAPRLTVYRNELYDCAECINLGTMIRGRFEALDRLVDNTIDKLLVSWWLKKGHFRSRRLLLGWDNVPMHRWGQSQVFRALCFRLYSEM